MPNRVVCSTLASFSFRGNIEGYVVSRVTRKVIISVITRNNQRFPGKGKRWFTQKSKATNSVFAMNEWRQREKKPLCVCIFFTRLLHHALWDICPSRYFLHCVLYRFVESIEELSPFLRSRHVYVRSKTYFSVFVFFCVLNNFSIWVEFVWERNCISRHMMRVLFQSITL
jgi:hypothetical protein